MSKKTKADTLSPSPVHLTVDGCSVKLIFPPKSEKRVIDDVKHIILNNMSKVRK